MSGINPEPRSDAVTLYTTPGCVQCRFTEKELAKLHVPFETVSLADDGEARAWLKGLGYASAPVLITPMGTWTGFRPDALASLVDVVAA